MAGRRRGQQRPRRPWQLVRSRSPPVDQPVRSRSLEERGALALAGCAPAGVGPMRSLSPDGQPRCAHTHLRGRSHALVLAVEAGGWPCSPEGRSTAALAGGKRQRSRFRTTRGGNNRMGAEGGFRCPTGSAFLALWGLK